MVRPGAATSLLDAVARARAAVEAEPDELAAKEAAAWESLKR